MAGLYIHVPFCHAKCWYCDFYSVADASGTDRYVQALEREWTLRNNEINQDELTTIYFGGGTPSILSERHLWSIGEWLPVSEKIVEATIEVNPEDVSPEKISQWKRNLRVNRVSMGIQSLVDEELKAVGRRHSVAEALEAVNMLRREGINNLSLDLIYGLPGQTLDSWKESLNKIMAVRPEHLSAYMLSFEPGTRLHTRLMLGKIKETDEETMLAMYDTLCEAARANGYNHYEISNFALPGFEARHNSAYWTGAPYLGLGPGAHSFDGQVRRENPRNFRAWCEALSDSRSAATIEEESEADKVNDFIMVSLRTSKGLRLKDIPSKYHKAVLGSASRLTENRLLIDKESMRLYIPESGWPVSDGTIASLFVD
ncbi:MAG: radical SAM family heme chaperone HemW [Muribaculaceae bacterium]|nr:radical SAM family heme chaperone HemW [Muribaculaceae bacterium]